MGSKIASSELRSPGLVDLVDHQLVRSMDQFNKVASSNRWLPEELMTEFVPRSDKSAQDTSKRIGLEHCTGYQLLQCSTSTRSVGFKNVLHSSSIADQLRGKDPRPFRGTFQISDDGCATETIRKSL